MFSIASRPRENGRQLPSYPQSPGTQSPAERNIRASSGWLWQERSTLQRINQAFTGARLITARSIYLALTEGASQQHTPGRVHTSCAYLGSLAGCSERNARRYLHEFAALGLIAIEPGVHRANTYVLLGETIPADKLVVASMPLADDHGTSASAPAKERTTRQTTPISLASTVAKRRGGSDDRPAPHHKAASISPADGGTTLTAPERDDNHDHPSDARGDNTDSQDLTSESNKPKNQTTRVGGDESGAGMALDVGTAKADTRLLIPSEEQRAAVNSLTGIGVRRVLAEELAVSHDAATIRDWVRYTLKTDGLKSKAGFVLSRLRAGEQPPATPKYHLPLQYQPEPSWGLIEASTAEVSPTEEPAIPAPGTKEQAIWQAAREELLLTASGSAKLWLQHIRLIGVEANWLALSSPPVGGAAHANLYAARIGELLGTMLGRTVRVEFQAGW